MVDRSIVNYNTNHGSRLDGVDSWRVDTRTILLLMDSHAHAHILVEGSKKEGIHIQQLVEEGMQEDTRRGETSRRLRSSMIRGLWCLSQR
jgi:hypothetical protein